MSLKNITKCLGYTQVLAAATTTAFNLALPVGGLRPTMVRLQAETQALRYRDDGVAPTASVGMLLPVGASFDYDGDLNNLQLINATAGAICNYSFYA